MQRGHVLIPPGRRYAFLADRAVTFHFARITNQAIKKSPVFAPPDFIQKTGKELTRSSNLVSRIGNLVDIVNRFPAALFPTR